MRRYVCLLLMALLLLGGCQDKREYLSVTPHEEQYVENENADATVVSDYEGLVSALLQQCSRLEPSGLIRVYGYPGEIVEDVPKAVYYVAKQSALGAYAVDYITYDCNQVVSYYEISVDITYSKTMEELQALIATRGENAIRLRISNALQSYAPELALRIYGTELFDVQSFVQEYYDENPGSLQICPQITTDVYPQKIENEYILKMQFSYPYSETVMQQRQAEVNAVVDAAVEYVQHRETEQEKLTQVFAYLAERFDYKQQPSDTPVYSALCEGMVDAYGAARTIKTLCDALGLECWVVKGSYHEEPWYWNIVLVDGQYYHADAMHCIAAGETSLILDLDSAMGFYAWPRDEYPICTLRPDSGIDMREDAEDLSGEFGENILPTP